MKTSEFKRFMEQTGYHGWTTGTNQLAIEGDTLPGSAIVSPNQVGEYQAIDLPKQVASVVQDYAWTPIAERKDEKRWNVVIGKEGEDEDTVFTIWEKYRCWYAITSVVGSDKLDEDDYIFTDQEFEELVNYINTYSDSSVYAKIAELGKREVVDDCL